MRYDTISPPPLTIEPIEPEHLEGDLIQPGDPLFGLIWMNPERMGGEPLFYATRVPIIALFQYLAAGETLDEFLYQFEGVSREQALNVLELAVRGTVGKLDGIRASAARSQPAAGAATADAAPRRLDDSVQGVGPPAERAPATGRGR
jgi:uncharacterized protein (DUF433 family)